MRPYIGDPGVGDDVVDMRYVVFGLEETDGCVSSISKMTRALDGPVARRVRASMLACEGLRTAAIIL